MYRVFKSLGFNIICRVNRILVKNCLSKIKITTMVLNLTGYFDKPCHCKTPDLQVFLYLVYIIKHTFINIKHRGL